MNMKLFLAVIMTVFCGIMVGVYLVARQASPVMLDEHGRPIAGTAEARRP